MSPTPSISVCMIACNEADNLPAALDSVRTFADEVVLVDTGSRDATAAIAATRGVRVVEDKWQDDFSHSRNQALANAKSDWILVLDADERVAAGQEEKVRRLIRGDSDAWFVKIRSPLGGRRKGQTFVHYFERLFRSHPEVRFHGRVHEQVGPSLAAVGARVGKSDLLVEHTGYVSDAARGREKLQRNLRLLRLDAGERPDDGYVQFQLAETYAMLGRSDEAIDLYRRALDNRALVDGYRPPAHQNLASALLKLGRWQESLQHCDRALALDAQMHAARLVRAAALLHGGCFDDAVQDVDTYLDAVQEIGEGSFGFEPDTARALRIRGECHLRAGRIEAATADGERLTHESPAWAGGHRLLAAVQVRVGDVTAAIDSLQRAVAHDPEDARSWMALVKLQSESGDDAKARQTVREALEHIRSADLYRWAGRLASQAGDWPEAIDSYRSLLQHQPDDSEAIRRLAGLCHKLGRSDEARAYLARLPYVAGREPVSRAAVEEEQA